MPYVQYRVPARRALLSAPARGALVVVSICVVTITAALYLTAQAWCARPGEWVLPPYLG